MLQQATLALATLAASTGLLVGALVTTHDLRLLSMRLFAGIGDLTAGDGPWAFGVMPADLTLAELEEYLENNGPLTPTDTVGVERASRGKLIRTLGVIVPRGDGTTASLELNNVSLAGLKVGEDAGGITAWVYNLGRAMSTGASLRMLAQYFIEWAT